MKVSAAFERDLERAYEAVITWNQFFEMHGHVLRAIGKHALRYKTHWMLSDEDDMYQEACHWMFQALWEYDDTRNVSLSKYVLYNVGARLNTCIRFERAKKRHPDANKSYKLDIWGPINKSDDSIEFEDKKIIEETLTNPSANPETSLAIKRAFDTAEKELTGLALEYLDALIKENGVKIDACKRLIRKPHIRKRFGKDPNYLKRQLDRRVMPEIASHFDLMAIIPVDTMGKPSNG